jgi:hypothetical protein
VDPTDTVVPVTKRAKRGECHAVLKKEDALKDSTAVPKSNSTYMFCGQNSNMEEGVRGWDEAEVRLRWGW